MTTTYVERNNTNAEVFRGANEKIRQETQEGKIPKQIVPFVTSYLNSRMKRLARIYKMRDGHPVNTHNISTKQGATYQAMDAPKQKGRTTEI